MDSDIQRITGTLSQIMQRLDALEAQVAALSGLAGGGRPAGGQPQPMAGPPIPSSGYGSLGPGGPATPGAQFPDVVQLARSGNKVAAIKLYRQYTGVSLNEARYFVESC